MTAYCADEFVFTLSGDDGLVLVPSGNPEIVTDTSPMNPFAPAMETVTGVLVFP